MKNTIILLLCCCAIMTFQCVSTTTNKVSQNINSPIQDLKNWLSKPVGQRASLESTTFATEKLTKTQAEEAGKLLYSDKQALLLKKYGIEWDNRELSYQDYKMPFFYEKFGTVPENGRSLYISLHGGGGAPKSVNDQQYNNQKHLYDATMKDIEGVYLAPRAPTNTWNLWHESHIDEFFNIIIQMAVIKENVNPNKVYLLGYSAGGDGVYQLAPRMADRWAAAAMMAGHPNDASPLSLRNTPFTIHMGGEDAAYDRNKVAQEWSDQLDELQNNDSKDAYIHEVQIHEGLGHWMKLEDRVAIPWMSKYQRNSIPDKVVWKQNGRHHNSFYWVKTPKDKIETGGEINVAYNRTTNEVIISENYSESIELMINDKMLDLDKPVTVKYKDKILHQGVFKRSILNINNSLSEKGDLNLVFSCKVLVENNSIVK